VHLLVSLKRNLPPSCTECLEIWQPQTPGTLKACPGLYR